MEKYLVIRVEKELGVMPKGRFDVDVALAASPRDAIEQIAAIRTTSDIVMAVTAQQLREYAAKLDEVPTENSSAKCYMVVRFEPVPVSQGRFPQCKCGLDIALAITRQDAIRQLADIDKTSTIVTAFTSEQLHGMASEMENISPDQIALSHVLRSEKQKQPCAA